MDNLVISALPPFLAYCFVQGITPGPANLCSLSTTLRHGTSAALRQWAGLLVGFIIVAVVSVAVTWGAREWFGQVLPGLTVLGAFYVVWLACKMLVSSHNSDGSFENEPTFISGVLVQVTNAKVILMCLTALVAYAVPIAEGLGALLAFGMAIPVIGLSCNMAWIVAGSHLRTWYEMHRRPIDAAMAAMLLLCALDMVVPLLFA